MVEEIGKIVIGGLITLFIVLLYFILGVYSIGGYMYPLMESMNPGGSGGISEEQYSDTANTIWTGFKLVFYLLVVLIFGYVAIRILYKKEEISAFYR